MEVLDGIRAKVVAFLYILLIDGFGLVQLYKLVLGTVWHF